MKQQVLIALTALVAVSLAALPSDPGWQLQDRIKRNNFQDRQGFHFIYGQPDGVPADYLVWKVSGIGEVEDQILAYELDNMDNVLKFTESQTDAWFDEFVDEAQAIADSDSSVMKVWTSLFRVSVVRDKLMVSVRFPTFEVDPDELEEDEQAVRRGDIMIWFVVDIATNTVESHFMSRVCSATDGMAGAELVYETENAYVLFTGFANEFNEACDLWYGFVTLNKDGSGGGFLPGGEIVEFDSAEYEGIWPRGVFRYDVENDPAGKLSEWGNPKGVIWMPLAREDPLDEDTVFPSVMAFKVDSAGVPSLEWHEELDPLLRHSTDNMGFYRQGAADTSDAFAFMASQEPWDERCDWYGRRTEDWEYCGHSTEVILMEKTLDVNDLVADRKAWHSSNGQVDIGGFVLTGSLADDSLIGVTNGDESAPGRNSGADDLIASMTFFLEDGEMVSLRPGTWSNCRSPTVTSVEGKPDSECKHNGNVGFWETTLGVNGRMNKIPNEGDGSQSVAIYVQKSCGQSGCKLYFSAFLTTWFAEILMEDNIVVVPWVYNLFAGAALVGGGAYGYRARSQSGGKAAVGKHAAELTAASPSASETGEGLTPLKRPAPGGSKRGSTGSKRGSTGGSSRGSKRGSGASRGSKRGSGASRGSKRASTGSKRGAAEAV